MTVLDAAPLFLCGPVLLLAIGGVVKQVRIRLKMAHWEAVNRVRDWERREGL